MAEGGGARFLRGLVTAAVIVAVIVLIAVFWKPVLDALGSVGDYIRDHTPKESGQRVAVVVYLIVAAVLGVVFSRAGHFMAYGIILGLGPLLWVLFWEGFPPLGLNPTWTARLGIGHLGPAEVALWAAVAAVLITLVFVPLELREKYLRRKHQLADSE